MSSGDEFDNLTDEFEGVDWSTVPALTGPAESSSFAEIPTQSQDSITAESPVRPSSSHSSSYYSGDEDLLDASFLAEVDLLEEQQYQTQSSTLGGSPRRDVPRSTHNGARVEFVPQIPTQATHEASVTTTKTKPPLLQPPPRKSPQRLKYDTPSKKRSRSDSVSSVSPNKKGKMKAVENNEEVRHVLEEFEDEMTCPICCDIFVAAHLGNPCGHSFCGSCGWQWISKNVTATCAICRSRLNIAMPMIPNRAIDNTVEKHMHALASSGNEDWKPGGKKRVEWDARLSEWKKTLEERARAARLLPRAPIVFPTFTMDRDWVPPDEEEAEGESSESSSSVVELVPVAVRRRRARRGRGRGGGDGTGEHRPWRNRGRGRRGG